MLLITGDSFLLDSDTFFEYCGTGYIMRVVLDGDNLLQETNELNNVAIIEDVVIAGDICSGGSTLNLMNNTTR